MKTTDSLLTPAQKDALILALTEHVQSECSVIDMEQRFRDMIDECYSFDAIGGPFQCMTPSHVLETMDPIAFRSGVSDQSDIEQVFEIEGEYYDQVRVEEARDSFVEDLQTELDSAQEELDAQEADEGADAEDVAEARAAVALLEAKIELASSHSF